VTLTDVRLQPRLTSPLSAGSTGALPDDLLEQAAWRISILAAFGCFVGLGASVILLVFGDPERPASGAHRPVALTALMLVASLALLVISRRRSLPARLRIDCGLVWLVVCCFALSVFRHWIPYGPGDVLRGPPPTMVVILLFAVLVPVAPRRMLVTALAAAASDGLALWLTVALGNPAPPRELIAWILVPSLGSVVLATVASRIIYALGRSVGKARELGSYRLVRRLGEGGMGEVWLAQHRMLARPAAIKVVRADALGLRDPEAASTVLRRFEREAQATAALESPHTVALYDFGTGADGTFYYVMELLDGMDLQALVDRHGAVPPARAVYLLLQVCHSLRDAHAAGVIHRDIKPANIYVCRKGVELDWIKVLDFGLVKQITGPADPAITTDNAVAGTPTYMAPEVALGNRDADARTDLYALGCVAYWLLVGAPPFHADTPMEMMIAQIQTTPEPPSRRAGEAIPAELDQIVMRLLAKHPDDRFADTAELADALRATGLADAWTADDRARWWAEHGDTGATDAENTAAAARLVLADTLPHTPRA